jgi:hypothetical protein
MADGLLEAKSQDRFIDLSSHGPELSGLLQGRGLSLSKNAKLPSKQAWVLASKA